MNNTQRVLIVEDEADIASILKLNLEGDGYAVDTLNSGETVLPFVKKYMPHIILLDVMIPVKSGFEVCKELKADPDTQHVPIIFLTAKSLERNVISGLEIGADDYITKPFSVSIVLSRVNAVLRRIVQSKQASNTEHHTVAGLTIDKQRMQIKTVEGVLPLTTTEYQLLVYLMDKPGWVFKRSQLMDACKGEDNFVTDRSIDVLMVSIRKKLGTYAPLVETVRGMGYRFKDSAR